MPVKQCQRIIMKSLKPKQCRVCSTWFEPFKSTQVVCSPTCAIALSKKKVARKRKQELKDNHLPDIFKRLQTEINAIARAIDYGLPCLARGHYPNQMHGGHIFSVGGNNGMRFNLHNIHRQGAQSNHFGNDDGLLRSELKKEYGNEYFEFLESNRGVSLPKLPPSEWMEILKAARQSKRLIQSVITEPLTVSERVELRNNVNEDLGIYNNQFSIFNYG